MEIITRSEAEFREVAGRIFEENVNRRVFLLYGEMGAGKTTMVQTWGEKIGLLRMTSPTFVVVKSYELPVLAKFGDYEYERVNHTDLYRISSEAEVETLGVFEMVGDFRSLLFVEWPELVDDRWPQSAVRIRLERVPGEEEARRIIVK